MAPLPTWRQLSAVISSGNLSEEELTNPWLRQNDVALMFSRSACALYAIILWWQFVFKKNNPVIWIPDYFCNESLYAIRDTSAIIIFYPINNQFQPNWELCTELALVSPPDIFILVHYFGIPSDAVATLDFCRKRSSLIIEDAAHVFLPTTGIGEIGDFVLYSPHKLLAIGDGSVCVIRDTINKVQIANGVCTEPKSLMKFIRDSISLKAPNIGKWLIKRVIQKTCPLLLLRNKNISIGKQASKAVVLFPQQSWLSKKLLGMNLCDLKIKAEKRKLNLKVWTSILESIGFSPIESNLFSIPYLAVLKLKLDQGADQACDIFRKIRIPASTWPDLPNEVLEEPSHHEVAHELRKSIVTFPVHHTISSKQFTNSLKSLLRNRSQLTSPDSYSLSAVTDVKVWNEYFSHISHSNLLQSWNYGESKRNIEGWQVERALIMKNKQPIGMVQFLEKNIFKLGRVVRINRGPLWFSSPSTNELVGAYSLLKNTFNLWQRKILFIAPELLESSSTEVILSALGYKKRNVSPWTSSRVDLTKSQIELRQMIEGKWRNQLKAAEKLGLSISVSNQRDDFESLMNLYKENQAAKNFTGTSIAMLNSLAKLAEENETTLLVNTQDSNETISSALFGVHGGACTYLVGWNGAKGRSKNGMNFLLWNSMLIMRSRKIWQFDLGGLDANLTPSIAKFKRGICGSEYTLIGEYYVI